LEAISRVETLLAQGRRVILGIAAGPGAGSLHWPRLCNATLPTAASTCPWTAFTWRPGVGPLGCVICKGAPQTFDSAGFVDLLKRLRHQTPGETIDAPDFDRSLEESIAGSLALEGDKPLLITEGITC